MTKTEDFLEHYGVRGMKWGKSKGRSSSTPRKTEREASKDAKETAEAKMFYGEGAGIRRRHINNAVKSKMKDPVYKEAYERNLANQNMAKAGSSARSQRKVRNAKNGAVKTAKGVRHIMNGNNQYANISAAAVVAGAAYAKSRGVDKILLRVGKETIQNIRDNL